jgi:YegS/Rv2252/BmrU family lipid kinase
MRQALFLINPNSRSGDGDIDPILNELRAGGIELIMPSTDSRSDMLRAIAEQGPASDLLIVGGGDGTVNGALDAVLELEKPLGVLPLGTANDLARTLDLPADAQASADVVLNGKTRRIDVGVVNDKPFLNVASIGISVDLAEELDADRKATWGVLSYPIGLWQAAKDRKAIPVEITCDGQVLKTRAIQISIGNGRFYGGGMTIAADATIDDGMLDLVLMAPQPLLSLLGRLPLFRFGRHDLNGRVHHLRGRAIELVTETARPINTDGEITFETPATFRLLPKALEVFVP